MPDAESQTNPKWKFVITDRGIVYLNQEIRLPFAITDDGQLCFAVREKWLRPKYGKTVTIDLQDLVDACKWHKTVKEAQRANRSRLGL